MRKIYLLLFVVFLQGCILKKYPVRYGVDFNPTREKLGINLLDSTWKVKRTTSFYTRWVNPNIDRTKAQYIMKQTCYFDDILSLEMDTYQNVDAGTLIPERLSIRFYYRSSKYDRKNIFKQKNDNIIGWNYRHTCDNGYEGVHTTYLSKQQADSIMRAWKLKNETAH